FVGASKKPADENESAGDKPADENEPAGDKSAEENEPAGDKAPTGNLTAPDASPVLHHIERRMCDCCGACVGACMPGALRIFGEKITAARAAELLLEDADFYEQSGGGATFSGGEPLLQADFCAAVMRILKDSGTHIAVDTCGDVPWAAFQTVLPYTDMFLFDLKYVDADKLATWTGGSVGRIVGNLRALAARGALCEIRIPVIPGFNDDDAALLAMGRLAASMPNITCVRLLAYHNLSGGKYDSLGMRDAMPKTAPPTARRMEEIKTMMSGVCPNVILSGEV
ncbi:MAG: glycyl-radical enzyme activating protein, partial [Oscillospiraceae bacterium]|nr:glycyl-radical enzyme activating protein [Oscillospiraceae bacterium]